MVHCLINLFNLISDSISPGRECKIYQGPYNEWGGIVRLGEKNLYKTEGYFFELRFFRTFRSKQTFNFSIFERLHFWLCDFFSIFFVSKGPPNKFFDILQQTEVSKSPKGLPFKFFGTMKLAQIPIS